MQDDVAYERLVAEGKIEIPADIQELVRETNRPSKHPYSATEVLLASRHPSSEYHRHLMAWAGNRILELEAELKANT